MGLHKKDSGIQIINFLCKLGETLGYSIMEEEPMFPDEKNTPFFDVTWRLIATSRFPLFIFEVESDLVKSSTDNAVKLFSKKTPSYIKPLHFYQIYLSNQPSSSRVLTLKEMFDSVNYSLINIEDRQELFNFLTTVIEKHLQFNSNIKLDEIITFLLYHLNSDEINKLLNWFLVNGYDKEKGLDFNCSLERMILKFNVASIREFYLQYLPKYLKYEIRINSYFYLTSSGYSEITQHAINIYFNKNINYGSAYLEIEKIAKSYDPFYLWAPYFGISYDHKILLLSEFPIILSVLSLAFSCSQYAKEYSTIQYNLVKAYGGIDEWSLHSFIWLLISSQISENIEAYNYAKNMLNSKGGIELQLLLQPTTGVSDEPEERIVNSKNDFIIPDYEGWSEALYDLIEYKDIDILKSIIDSLLIMNNPYDGREKLAQYCLLKSVRKNDS